MKEAHYERGATWLERALAAAPDRDARAAVLAVQGVVACDQGRTTAGIELLREAAALAVELDKPRLEAWSLAFLGRAYLLRDELEPARLWWPAPSPAPPAGSLRLRTSSRR
jgi:hypothetical protein